MSASPSNSGPPSAGAKILQERLNYLLSRLSACIDTIKTWPSTDGDDASIHVKTTSKLISSVIEIKMALEKVEGAVKADAHLRKALQDCPIPINLLDLLDHGNGLNPDCFSRGLLREALGQLAGLKRRKLALEMLGAAVQTGLNRRLGESKSSITGSSENCSKRQRDKGNIKTQDKEGEAERPATKKTKTEAVEASS